MSNQETKAGSGSLLGIVVRSAVAAGLVTLLYGTGSLNGMQAAWADAFERVFRASPSPYTAVVAITDQDYNRADLFAASSPLDPAVLTRIVERLAAHRPAAVAIDVMLQPPPQESEQRRRDRRELYATLSRLAREGATRWVLVEPDAAQPASSDAATQSAWDALRQMPPESASHLTWASANLTAEEGLIRHIGHCAPSAPTAARRFTMQGALISAAGASVDCTPPASGRASVLRIRYTAGFGDSDDNRRRGRVFSVGELLAPVEAPHDDTILTGKVIVLGGTYGDQDIHWTPAGSMHGVQVWAEAFDSWKRNDALYEPPWFVVFLLQTFIAATCGWLTRSLSPLWGYTAAFASMGALTAIFTWMSFGAGFFVVSALPCFFASQMNLQFGSLPELLADYAQRRVDRHRRRKLGDGRG